MSARVIENPKSDSDLPLRVQKQIEEYVNAGWIREVLLISEQGEVIVDPEAVSYDQLMQSEQPGRDRSEYMVRQYPAKIYVDE